MKPSSRTLRRSADRKSDHACVLFLTGGLYGRNYLRRRHRQYRGCDALPECETGLSSRSLAEAKKDRTSEEDGMPDMMRCGGERIRAENPSAVLDRYGAQQ